MSAASSSSRGWWLSAGLCAVALLLTWMGRTKGVGSVAGAPVHEGSASPERAGVELESASEEAGGSEVAPFTDVAPPLVDEPESARSSTELTLVLSEQDGEPYSGSAFLRLHDGRGQLHEVRFAGAAPIVLDGLSSGPGSLLIWHDSAASRAAFELEPGEQRLEVPLRRNRIVSARLQLTDWTPEQRRGFFRNPRCIVVTDGPRLDLNGSSAQAIIQNSEFGNQRWGAVEGRNEPEDHFMWLNVVGEGPHFAHLICGEKAVETVPVPPSADEVAFSLTSEDLPGVFATVRFRLLPDEALGRREVSLVTVHEVEYLEEGGMNVEALADGTWVLSRMNPGMFEIVVRAEGPGDRAWGANLRGTLDFGETLDLGPVALEPVRQLTVRPLVDGEPESMVSLRPRAFMGQAVPLGGGPNYLPTPQPSGSLSYDIGPLASWLFFGGDDDHRASVFVPAGRADIDLGELKLLPRERVRLRLPQDRSVRFYRLTDLGRGTPPRTYPVGIEEQLELGVEPGRHRVETLDRNRGLLGAREFELERGEGPLFLDLRR